MGESAGIPYQFGFFDSLAAELAGVPMAAMHTDVDAMIAGADAMGPLAERLGVPWPAPHIADLAYVHVSTLGAKVDLPPGAAEPSVSPCIRTSADIDGLREPGDYLAAGLVPRRLKLVAELRRRRPGASPSIGHDMEGPATTAALLMGPEFFTLPHDDPARARKLLAFCTRSALNYARLINDLQGTPLTSDVEFPDDFAGMFSPSVFRDFVMPCWEQIYRELGATRRSVHCELLRPGHLPMLEELKINSYDPSVDQYLQADDLRRHCRVGYGLRIWPSWVQDKSAEELVALYRRFLADRPQYIMFHLHRPADEPKIAALLSVARENGPRGEAGRYVREGG
jgi:hypothetical protein